MFILLQVIVLPVIVLLYFKMFSLVYPPTPEIQGWMTIGLICIMAFWLYWVILKNWSSIKPLFRTEHLGEDIALGVLSWIIGFPVIVFISQLLTWILTDQLGFRFEDQVAVRQIKAIWHHPILLGLTLFTVSIIVPFIEEVLFRGFLQSSLRNYFNMIGSISIAALIFSCFHFSLSQGINNIHIITSLFFLSLILGFLRERQGTIYPSIALHGTFNAMSLFMLSFAEAAA